MKRKEGELRLFGKGLILSLRNVIASEERIELNEVALEDILLFLQEHKFTRTELTESLRIGRANTVKQYSPRTIRAKALELLLAQIVIEKTREKIADRYAVPNKGKSLKLREILKFLEGQKHQKGGLMGFGIAIEIIEHYSEEYLLQNAIRYLKIELIR